MLPDTNPVGAYFNVLYNTGFYYEFIGWSQIIAAVLLLIPRTSHIGALMFLPIIVNIAVLTSSVGFVGTWLITLLMAFAAAWLVTWEYDRLKPIVFRTREEKPRRMPYQFLTVPAFFALGGVAMAVLWWMIRLREFLKLPHYRDRIDIVSVSCSGWSSRCIIASCRSGILKTPVDTCRAFVYIRCLPTTHYDGGRDRYLSTSNTCARATTI